MVAHIAYYQIAGYPLIMWLGVVLLLLLLATAAIGAMNRRGMRRIPIRWHFILAWLSLLLALVHGVLGIAIFIPAGV
jgi:hypothetical protein